MTIANWITLFRLVLVPVCCWLVWAYTPEEAWLRWAALAGFATAAVSDALDGYLARKLGQRTRLGAILDPLADKLLVNLMVIFLALNKNFETPLPLWLPILLLSRDAVILAGSWWVNHTRGPLHPKPRILGKITTLVNCVGIVAVLAEVPFTGILIWVMGAFVLLSGLDYLAFGLSDHPHTGKPTPPEAPAT